MLTRRSTPQLPSLAAKNENPPTAIAAVASGAGATMAVWLRREGWAFAAALNRRSASA